MINCIHQHDYGSKTHYQCDNHAKLIHNGTVPKSFCTTCPYRTPRMQGAGDLLAAGLNAVGITKERVQAVAGLVGIVDCGCQQRQDALNAMLPFSSEPPLVDVVDMAQSVRHLTYHVWPTRHQDAWQWNLQQLARRWDLFNGRKALGIVYDRQSHMPDAVRQYSRDLGLDWDFVYVRRNKPHLGEVLTWGPRLEFLQPEQASANEVVFAAHAKGVKYSGPVQIIRRWAELGYAASLDVWPLVQEQLSRHVATGPFKKYVGFVLPGIEHWHYSGTFFWFRLADLARREWRVVDQMYAGTETWIGRHARAWETGCTFLDHCGMLYDENYWRDAVEPAWKAFARVHNLVSTVCPQLAS